MRIIDVNYFGATLKSGLVSVRQCSVCNGYRAVTSELPYEIPLRTGQKVKGPVVVMFDEHASRSGAHYCRALSSASYPMYGGYRVFQYTFEEIEMVPLELVSYIRGTELVEFTQDLPYGHSAVVIGRGKQLIEPESELICPYCWRARVERNAKYSQGHLFLAEIREPQITEEGEVKLTEEDVPARIQDEYQAGVEIVDSIFDHKVAFLGKQGTLLVRGTDGLLVIPEGSEAIWTHPEHETLTIQGPAKLAVYHPWPDSGQD